MNKKIIEITVPFPFCEDCAYFAMQENAMISEGKKYLTIRGCENEEICRNVISKYKRLLREREARPYDALGDDQGRGGTDADSWYRENFTEAEAYEEEEKDG